MATAENALAKSFAQQSAEQERYPWDRLDAEPFAAYAAFAEYRSQDPKTRSHRKLAVNATQAARWSTRFRWVARAAQYDTWLLDMGERQGRDGVLRRKHKLVSFAFASLDKALCAVKALPNPTDVESVVALAEAGAELSAKGLGINETVNRQPSIGVNVNVGSPLPWGANNNQTDINQNDNKELVVLPQEKVLDGTKRAPGQRPLPKRLVERVVNQPVGSSKSRSADK